MLYFLLCLVHVAVCVLLIFFVLIQSNKGMGLSGAFGAVGGDSVFGSSSSINILVKITIILGIIFATSSITLSVVPPPSPGGVITEETTSTSVSDLIETSKTAGQEAPVPAGEEMAPPDIEQPEREAPVEENPQQ